MENQESASGFTVDEIQFLEMLAMKTIGEVTNIVINDENGVAFDHKGAALLGLFSRMLAVIADVVAADDAFTEDVQKAAVGSLTAAFPISNVTGRKSRNSVEEPSETLQ
jgi:hypothetical protein